MRAHAVWASVYTFLRKSWGDPAGIEWVVQQQLDLSSISLPNKIIIGWHRKVQPRPYQLGYGTPSTLHTQTNSNPPEPLQGIGTMFTLGKARYHHHSNIVAERWSYCALFDLQTAYATGILLYPKKYVKIPEFARNSHEQQVSKRLGWTHVIVPELSCIIRQAYCSSGTRHRILHFLSWPAGNMSYRHLPRAIREAAVVFALQGARVSCFVVVHGAWMAFSWHPSVCRTGRGTLDQCVEIWPHCVHVVDILMC